MLIISIKSKEIAKLTLIKNIIYTSLIKCKKVTYAILALKLYAMVARVDMLITLSSIINKITNKLEIKQLLTIIYTKSLSLYKYIIKLDITKKNV